MHSLVDDLMHEAHGVLSVGASYTYGEYVLPHIIASLRKSHKLIKPSITIGNTREIAELVLRHTIDVGIIEGDFKHDNLTIEPFAEDRMYVVCSSAHRFAKQNKASISELKEETWIIREPGSGTREATERLFAAFQSRPGDIMEFGSTQIILESVEAGMGISLLSNWAIRKEVSLGSMKIIEIDDGPILRYFSIVTQASTFRTKATEVFLDTLRNSKV